jgi:hypothetical protein
MSNVFSRPLFRSNFIQRFAEGGIVSTVAGPEQQPDPMAVLTGMAEQVEVTEQNLDAAGNLDEILTSFAGQEKTGEMARAELAELVGEQDASATPESVLALVQPTMAILQMSRQMSPPGGIASAPMPGEQPAAPQEGAAPVNFMMGPEGAPLPAFNVGGDVNYNAIMQQYAGMQSAIPKNYGSDPSSAWLALAQLGAGMATGKTFAEGLSKGTQMAGPYMQAGIENRNRERSALSTFVASEAQRQQSAAAAIADREDQQEFQSELTNRQLQARKDEIRLEAKYRQPGDSIQLLERLDKLHTLMYELPDDDPTRTQIQGQIERIERTLYKTTDTPNDITIAERVASGEGLMKGTPEFEARVSKLLTSDTTKSPDDIIKAERIASGEGLTKGTQPFEARVAELLNAPTKDNTPAALAKAKRIKELRVLLDAEPTNKNYQYELEALQTPENGDESTAAIKRAQRIAALEAIVRNNPNDQLAKDELKALNENSGGVNINFAEKQTAQVYKDFAERKEKVYYPDQQSRNTQLNSIKLLKAIQEVDVSQGGFEQGLAPEIRIQLGQLAQSFGYNPADISKFISGPEFGQYFETVARGLSLEQQKSMQRGTNLTLQIIQSANANIGKNPQANKLWLDVQEKVLTWENENDEYLSLLDRYYGTDDPAVIKRVDPENPSMIGYNVPTKPLSKLSKKELFDSSDRPLLSYNDYVRWRSIHEPAINDSVKQTIIAAAKAPSGTVQFPQLDENGVRTTAPNTVRETLTTPDVNIDNKPRKQIQLKVDGQLEPDVFVLDPTTNLYIGQRSGKKFNAQTKSFVP